VAAVRNREGIQFAAFRDGFDQRFEAIHDALEEAYYNFWKRGSPQPVVIAGRTLDVVAGVPTLVTNQGPPQTRTFPGLSAKDFFDRLHGLIWHHYQIKFHRRNMALPLGSRIPLAKYEEIRDEAGTVVERRSETAQARIDALNAEGIDLEP